MKANINDCIITDLEKNSFEKGNITIVENGKNIPFDIQRIYYLYDVPSGQERGGHAHKRLYQLLVAVGGSFEVILDNGKDKKTVLLNRPHQGLLIVPGIWRELKNFSSGSVCLVLASTVYDESDYIRNYNDFIEYAND